RADHLPLRILEHRGVGAGAEGDRGDVAAGEPGCGKGAGDGVAQGPPPVGRVLFAPARTRAGGAQLGARRTAHAAVGGDDHRLQAAGTDIDAHQVRALHGPVPGSIVSSSRLGTAYFMPIFPGQRMLCGSMPDLIDCISAMPLPPNWLSRWGASRMPTPWWSFITPPASLAASAAARTIRSCSATASSRSSGPFGTPKRG